MLVLISVHAEPSLPSLENEVVSRRVESQLSCRSTRSRPPQNYERTVPSKRPALDPGQGHCSSGVERERNALRRLRHVDHHVAALPGSFVGPNELRGVAHEPARWSCAAPVVVGARVVGRVAGSLAGIELYCVRRSITLHALCRRTRPKYRTGKRLRSRKR